MVYGEVIPSRSTHHISARRGEPENNTKEVGMRLKELNDEQMLQLKQSILEARNEARGEGTSYGELSMADNLVSDEDLADWYDGTEFSEGDFS